MSVKKSLKNSVWEGFALGTQMLISLFIIRVINQRFGIADFGTYNFWVTLVSYMGIIIDLGLNLTGIREIGVYQRTKQHKKLAVLYSSSTVLRGIGAIIASLVGIFLFYIGKLDMIQLLLVLSGAVYATFESTWFLQGFNEYKVRSGLIVLSQVANLLIAMRVTSSVLIIVLLRNIVFILRDFFAFLYVGIKYKAFTFVKVKEVVRLLKETFINHITLLMSIGYKRAYPLILRFVLDKTTYGILSAIYRILNIGLTVQSMFTKPFFSTMTHIKDRAKLFFMTWFSTALTVTASVGAMVFIFVTPLFSLIYPGLGHSGVVLQYFIGAVIALFGLSVSGHLNMIVLILHHYDKQLAKIMMIKVFLTLAMLYIFMRFDIMYMTFWLFAPMWISEFINIVYDIYVFRNRKIQQK